MNRLSAGAIGLRGGLFSDDSRPVVLEEVNCTGAELSLQECPQTLVSGDVRCDEAGVVCQGLLQQVNLPTKCMLNNGTGIPF